MDLDEFLLCPLNDSVPEFLLLRVLLSRSFDLELLLCPSFGISSVGDFDTDRLLLDRFLSSLPIVGDADLCLLRRDLERRCEDGASGRTFLRPEECEDLEDVEEDLEDDEDDDDEDDDRERRRRLPRERLLLRERELDEDRDVNDEELYD